MYGARKDENTHTMTEAEKMVNDYNNGIAIFDSIELPDEQTLII